MFERRTARRCCSCRWRTSSPGSSRSAASPSGVTLGHTPDVTNLLDDLVAFRPTFLLAVPRVFEKVYNGAQAKATADGKGAHLRPGGRARRSRTAEALDTRRSRARAARPARRVRPARLRQAARRAGRAQVDYAVSGGAPLGARLGHFFRGIGVTVLEGYGLTETTAASTVNTSGRDHGSARVGRPIPGSGVRIADDGEVLLRGPHVFARLLANDDGDRGGARRRRLVPAPATSASSTTTATCRSPGARRRSSSPPAGKNVAPRRARGPHPGAPAGRRSAWWSATSGRSSPRSSPSTPRRSRPGWPRTAPAADTAARRPRRRPGPARASPGGGRRRRTRPCRKAEAIKRFAVLPVDFTEAGGPADADAQAPPRRRAARLRRATSTRSTPEPGLPGTGRRANPAALT